MLLRHATTADGRRVDVRLAGGVIAAVEPAGSLAPQPGEATHDATGHVVLPAPAEPHAHLDKALTADRVPNPRGDLAGAVAAWHAEWPSLTVADIAARARAAALLQLSFGTTAVRTHVDVGSGVGLRSVEALLAVREELAGVVDLQVCALVSAPTAGPDGAAHRALQREALAMGADVGGGCPHLDPDPRGCLEACLAAAAEAGRPVDLHTDETLDAGALGLADFARLVAKTGFPHGAVASHCVSLGVQPAAVQAEVAAEVAEAGVAVVTLPQTNLFLQARGVATSPPRGLTALRALLDAGVTVAGGGDNLRDPFNGMGRGDPLETASLLVTAGHLSVQEAYAAVSAGARRAMGLPAVEVAPGFPADLVCVAATSLADAVAGASQQRLVFRRGTLVARTAVTRELPTLEPEVAR